MNDLSIVTQIRNGDVGAFEKIFAEYYGALCLFAKKFVGDMDVARDIVQEIFVSLYANRKTLDINSSLKSYLFKSVYNACLNYIKQRNTHSRHHQILQQHLPFSESHDEVTRAELEDKIRQAVESLPEQCRRIFKLNRFEGKRNHEIAAELGISIRTVETQISKALAALRYQLTDFLMLSSLAVIIS